MPRHSQAAKRVAPLRLQTFLREISPRREDCGSEGSRTDTGPQRRRILEVVPESAGHNGTIRHGRQSPPHPARSPKGAMRARRPKREMGRKLFIGNLPFDITDEDLSGIFSDPGIVKSAKVIVDRETGRSRGFGFVEFSTEEEATQAIEDWNEKVIGGRRLTVNEAQERSRRSGNGRSDSGSGHGDGRKRGKRGRGREGGYDRDR